MAVLPVLRVASVKIRCQNIERSRTWFREVFALHEVLEWADDGGVLRGVALAGLGEVLLALREEPTAAAATKRFGFINVAVPDEIDLDTCSAHLDTLGIKHTKVITGAQGRLVGFHDPDGHELSFCAVTPRTAFGPTDHVKLTVGSGTGRTAPSATTPAPTPTPSTPGPSDVRPSPRLLSSPTLIEPSLR